MVTLVPYGTLVRYVHIQVLLLSREYSIASASRLRLALERNLDLLAEPCDAFTGEDQHQACREIYDQCATLLALLRELTGSARPAKEEAATQLVRQLLVTIDRYRPLLGIEPEDQPKALQAEARK